jgi:ATPase subunit of ABC transporter with duplicated ATPase domains
MSLIPVIQLHHVSYTIQGQQSPLLQNISMTFLGSEKIGLVGPNGVGKSTLLKLITGQLRPSNGDIQCQGDIIFLPQHFRLEAQATVAEVLGISEKLASLKRITCGSVDERDYEVLNDDWTVADRTMSHLTKFGLGHLTWQQRIYQLSGGEQTRLHLCKTFICDADFLLLDEPTNNLDQTAREIVYQNMAEFSGGMIIASHDRV